ncbi:PadR family transcriptional regulator, partial [bacterium]
MNEDRTSLSQQEERVLLAIGNLGENAYGVTIRGTLVEAGTPTELAPLYVVLGRLEQRKLVKSWVGGATAERGGRAKKFYQL